MKLIKKLILFLLAFVLFISSISLASNELVVTSDNAPVEDTARK